ncbi:hypothetical protein H6H03_31905 [Nostoc paludosum FACHB-159]|uniref:Uncharacterized protein n=1 Tax=Nostoc paludosum FACHB-159 TaxID=2692908 RepID=A0ABR8KK39_9NOSO|nr:hypothetical protein [Nostoc sp. FACHB-857]MBD2738432.1 hypothetical protein [Nostoc paludosum FACHB-159]
MKIFINKVGELILAVIEENEGAQGQKSIGSTGKNSQIPNAQCPMPNAQCPLLVSRMQERVSWFFSSCTISADFWL